jgi:GNAT superfamily N-acetyltransferase
LKLKNYDHQISYWRSNSSLWRRGIARALIEALKQTCVERGVEVIFVGTEMDNEAAKQLYANTGGTLKVIAWYEYDL